MKKRTFYLPCLVAKYYLVVELWARGAIDQDEFFAELTSSITNSIHEYFLETLLYTQRSKVFARNTTLLSHSSNTTK